MKFDRNLLKFEKDDVIYNGIFIGLTRQNIFDYVAQGNLPSEDLILHYYKKSISELRDNQIEKILNDKNNS